MPFGPPFYLRLILTLTLLLLLFLLSGPLFSLFMRMSQGGPRVLKLNAQVFYNTCLGSVGSLATLLGLYTYNRYSALLANCGGRLDWGVQRSGLRV